jgi:hypothetical protein
MKPSVSRSFRLRFPLSEVASWADRYSYADDSEVRAIGARARERGWFRRAELITVALWKTNRSRSRVAGNSAGTVREATKLALSTSDERLRIGIPTLMEGVGLPTASVLLHVAHSEPYPIIDFRALWSMGLDTPPTYYSFAFWQRYVSHCRELAEAADTDMRTLDRALWQYSAEHQIVR